MAIKVRVIFEVMGWPEEALNLSLKKTIDILKGSNWKILREEYAKPEKISEKTYGSYLEFDAEVPKLQDLFMFTLTFAPSSVEVLSPAEFDIRAMEVQDILSDICAKIQTMDKDIKVLASQNRMLTAQLNKPESENKEEKGSKKHK